MDFQLGSKGKNICLEPNNWDTHALENLIDKVKDTILELNVKSEKVTLKTNL